MAVELTYLCMNHPWRWANNIKQIINNTPTDKISTILNECGEMYLQAFNLSDKQLLHYDFDSMSPEVKEHFKDAFLDANNENKAQYLEDVEKIYSLCRNRANQLNVDISKLPETLGELTK